MSKPIQEPIFPRQLRQQKYGIDQLFRRPAPVGGGDEISVFRAARYGSNITGIGTTDVTVLWNHWENCDENVFEPRDNTDNPDPIPGVDSVRFIRLLQPGRYTFSVKFHFTATVDGCKIVLNDGDPVWGRSEDFFSGPTHSYNSTGYVAWTWVALYPIIDPFDTEWPNFSGAGFVNVSYAIGCIAAAARSVNEAFLEISYEPEVAVCVPSS